MQNLRMSLSVSEAMRILKSAIEKQTGSKIEYMQIMNPDGLRARIGYLDIKIKPNGKVRKFNKPNLGVSKAVSDLMNQFDYPVYESEIVKNLSIKFDEIAIKRAIKYLIWKGEIVQKGRYYEKV